MKDLMITAYSGFSTVSGETNLTTVITNIRNGAYFHTVRKVEQQLRLGDLSKANAIKKQLPFFTLTGNYSALRQPYSLLRYNPVITVDVWMPSAVCLRPTPTLWRASSRPSGTASKSSSTCARRMPAVCAR